MARTLRPWPLFISDTIAGLFNNWSTFYPILQQTLRQYKLNGIDLDVEETVSLFNIEMLIGQLRTGFGSKFLIALAPVASALWGGANLSGFSYLQLYASSVGRDIAWFNAQFYSGFATLPPNKVVTGMIDNSADGGERHEVTATVGLHRADVRPPCRPVAEGAIIAVCASVHS